MNRTQRIGHQSELAFQMRCLELGIECAVPVGVERYDLVILRDRWQRVQIKTGKLAAGCIAFNTCSNAEGVGRPVGYTGFADAIGIYAPELDRSFLIPLAECPRGNARLRVEPARNNQQARLRWADDYAL